MRNEHLRARIDEYQPIQMRTILCPRESVDSVRAAIHAGIATYERAEVIHDVQRFIEQHFPTRVNGWEYVAEIDPTLQRMTLVIRLRPGGRPHRAPTVFVSIEFRDAMYPCLICWRHSHNNYEARNAEELGRAILDILSSRQFGALARQAIEEYIDEDDEQGIA